METAAEAYKENVKIQIPVKVDYKVLNTFLKKKFQGKILSKGKADGSTSDHARILEIALHRSQKEDFDIRLHTKLQLLTKLFRNKEIETDIHLSLRFSEVSQQIFIERYELEGENNSWLVNNAIEVIINTFLYSKIKGKMQADLRPVIAKQLENINIKLLQGLELKEGVFLSGKVERMHILGVVPGLDHLLVSVLILSNNQLNLKNIDL